MGIVKNVKIFKKLKNLKKKEESVEIVRTLMIENLRGRVALQKSLRSWCRAVFFSASSRVYAAGVCINSVEKSAVRLETALKKATAPHWSRCREAPGPVRYSIRWKSDYGRFVTDSTHKLSHWSPLAYRFACRQGPS